MQEPIIEELVDRVCCDCGEEFDCLFSIKRREDAEIAEENEHILGSRCRDCMVSKFPAYQEEIVGYAELIAAYLSIQEKYMSPEDWHELYGEEDQEEI